MQKLMYPLIPKELIKKIHELSCQINAAWTRQETICIAYELFHKSGGLRVVSYCYLTWFGKIQWIHRSSIGQFIDWYWLHEYPGKITEAIANLSEIIEAQAMNFDLATSLLDLLYITLEFYADPKNSRIASF